MHEGVSRSKMFNAIVSADTLKAALDSVSVLVDECKIHSKTTG